MDSQFSTLRQVGWIRGEDYALAMLLFLGILDLAASAFNWWPSVSGMPAQAIIMLLLTWAILIFYRLGYFAVQLLTLVTLLPDKAALIVSTGGDQRALNSLDGVLQAKLPKISEVYPALREVGWVRWQDMILALIAMVSFGAGVWHRHAHIIYIYVAIGTLTLILIMLGFRFSYFMLRAIADLNSMPAQVLYLLAQFERRP